MSFKIPTLAYTGNIRTIFLERDDRKVAIGGQNSYPFYTFEGELPNLPKIAIQVPDFTPDDWAETCLDPYKDVVGNPVAWAKKAQDVYKADLIFLWLKSTDPNGLNRSADEAAEIAKQVLEAINIPLIVWGSANVEKDAEVLRKVALACGGKRIALGPVQEGNHKQIGAQALAYNHIVVASSPIDINLAKQLNILLGNLGISSENILIDPTTGAIGYGIEYSYSVMERIRQAALTQQDEKLQFPMICNLADEVWKTKEAKLPDDLLLGKASNRGIILEAMTAVTLLLAGADILVMRHPKAIELVRNYIADMAGVARPVTVAVPAEVSQVVPSGITEVSGLPSGIFLEIDIAKVMDKPVTVGSDYLLAVVKVYEQEEGGIKISPEAKEVFSQFLSAKRIEEKPMVVKEESRVQEIPKK
ncbi:MAG: acetyl-CoA decarbonylase/synthase complex subunit delta, partial [Desulfobacterota bacterium]|nr:acetyl-CoA decarbonylase/synthase complex subunit delta [Thermodesulfobacteriota bacterium]